MKNNVRFVWVATAALAFLGLSALDATAQVSIIVSASSTAKASPAQVADMFAGVTTTWSTGSKVQIVDQPDTPVGKTFYMKLVKRPVTIVRAQWTKLSLSGQGLAPKRVADDEAMKDAVKKSPGAIGYIASSSLDASVKELARVE